MTSHEYLLISQYRLLKQYSRRDCWEIQGIPVLTGEDANGLVKKNGEQIAVQIQDQHISISHRLKDSRSGTNHDPVLILKFARRSERDEFNRAKKNLRSKSIRDIGITRLCGNFLILLDVIECGQTRSSCNSNEVLRIEIYFYSFIEFQLVTSGLHQNLHENVIG